jgi:hypothetical protein
MAVAEAFSRPPATKGSLRGNIASTTLRIQMALMSRVQATGKKPCKAALQLSPSVAIESARWRLRDMTTGRIEGV